MLGKALGYLRCPVCEQPFTPGDGSIVCASGHSFDVARQGYVNLLPGDARPGTADTAAMVTARAAFLGAGHYAPLARAIARAAAQAAHPDAPGCLVDVGAGTGYYTVAVLDALPAATGLALDLSKHAAKRSSRAHDRLQAVVCDAWAGLPVASGAAALVLDVFSPRNAVEFHRVLAPDGALIVATPTARHLQELVATLPMVRVDPDKDERLEEKLGVSFTRTGAELVEYPMALSHEDVVALVAMGPSSRHLAAERLGALAGALPEPFHATVSVTLSVFRPA